MCEKVLKLCQQNSTHLRHFHRVTPLKIENAAFLYGSRRGNRASEKPLKIRVNISEDPDLKLSLMAYASASGFHSEIGYKSRSGNSNTT